MSRYLKIQLLILTFAILQYSCKGGLNQKFDAQQKECDANWVKERADADFYSLVDESGNQVPASQIIGYWIGPGSEQSLRLDVSPKGCIAVPQHSRKGTVLVGRLDTRAMANISLEALKSEQNIPKLMLEPKKNLKLNLDCGTGGIFSQSEVRVKVSFSLNGLSLSSQQAKLITQAYRISVKFKEQIGSSAVAEYKLADWTKWEAGPALNLINSSLSDKGEANSISITQLFTRPGSYFAALEWSDFIGENVGENIIQENPSICPIVIDNEAPAPPGTSIPSLANSPFLSPGARLPIAISKDAELHYQVHRIASQELYKKWSTLRPEDRAKEVFEKGDLPTIYRGGLYRVRAYAEDKSGNRSNVIEQLLNVLEAPATRDTLADGWQVLELNENKKSIIAGPRWNGRAYSLGWAELDAGVPHTIKLSELQIDLFPSRLPAWQAIRSVKGRFGLAGNRNEEICFYRQGLYTGTNEEIAGHIQCFGWVESQWKVLLDQEIELWENEDLMTASVNGDSRMDFLIHDYKVGLARSLVIRDGKLTLTPEYSTNNLGSFGASRDRMILPLQAKDFSTTGGGSRYLMLDPNGYQGICYGTELLGATTRINESRINGGLGVFSAETTGLEHPLTNDFWFASQLTSRIRIVVGPDIRGLTNFDLVYTWNDKSRKFAAWNFSNDCLRQYYDIEGSGLPDLFGKRVSLFKSNVNDSVVFNAIVYPLNSSIAEPLSVYRFNGRSWDFVAKIENPAAMEQQVPETDPATRSSYPDSLESPWVDRSEASRSWGTMSVQQGDPLPFEILPSYKGYYRWTELNPRSPDKGSKKPESQRSRGGWRSGPWPYPQLLGTFLFELRVMRQGEAEPSVEQPADLQRLVSVLPPLSPSRSIMPGLSAMLQIKPGQAPVKITPKTWTNRPGHVQFTVETIEAASLSQEIELEEPWEFDKNLSFFSQQQLSVIVGRFGMAAGNPEALCYIHKAPVQAIAAKGKLACLAFHEERWQWVVKNIAIDIETQHELQSVELSDDVQGTLTHILQYIPGKRAAIVGKWDPLLQTFGFGNLPCYQSLYVDSLCGENGWNRAAAYPMLARASNSGQDEIIASFPYDVDRYGRGNTFNFGVLGKSNDLFKFPNKTLINRQPLVEPYVSAWGHTDFLGAEIVYGRRKLLTQMIPLAYAEGSFLVRLPAPGYDSASAFQLLRQPIDCNDSDKCFPHLYNLAGGKWDFLNDPNLQTFTSKNYIDQDQKAQSIIGVTPIDPDQDLRFYRWNCDGQSCAWLPFLNLPQTHDPVK